MEVNVLKKTLLSKNKYFLLCFHKILTTAHCLGILFKILKVNFYLAWT